MLPTLPSAPAGLKAFSLEGVIALVTGSTRGLGAAMALGLAEAGARVVLNGRKDDQVRRATASLTERGLAAHGQAFDVTDAASVERGIAHIESELGPIGVLVNNAGIQRRGPLHDLPEQDWRDVVDANLSSVYLVGTAVARRMIPRRRGKIINIASLMSEVARQTTGAYAASKGGVKMLTKAMCVDWAPHNIQVNAIGPGYFKTELNQALVDDPRFSGWLEQRTPAGRWGEPHELVGAAVFLASAASNFVNGQTLHVDGGVLASI
jgi:gluconate 5-dehydrogenase